MHLQNKYSYIKDREIEDFFDLKFYHPFGYYLAVFFNKLGFSPNMVSFLSMIVGVCGGFFIHYGKDIQGALFIVLASIIDSSDGQLARMSKKTSKYGRIIDGLVGYIIFTSVYISIALRYEGVYGWVTNGLHSSFYDFYRTAYLSIMKNNYEPFEKEEKEKNFLDKIYSLYSSYQNWICKYHKKFIEKVIKKEIILDEDKKIKYKKFMIENIQFVNLFGDNWKINGILFLSFINKLDLFFYYIIFIMNLVFVFVIIRQRKIDLKLMEEL